MDRRKFLETAGLLTAASAGASLLGGCSSGDPLLALTVATAWAAWAPKVWWVRL